VRKRWIDAQNHQGERQNYSRPDERVLSVSLELFGK